MKKRINLRVLLFVCIIVVISMAIYAQTFRYGYFALIVLTSDDDDDEWYGYRLGDVIRMGDRGLRHGLSIYHKALFPDSIATEYLKATSEQHDYKTLISIIDKRSNCSNCASLLPANDSLIIHLRTGDVIDLSPFSVEQILSKQREYRGHKYTMPLSFYQTEVLDKLATMNKNISKVVLVTGFHFNQNHEKSTKYIEAIRNFFETKGYDTKLRMSDPDSDFIFMCNSEYFVGGGVSGYSGLIGDIVKLKGGMVIHCASCLTDEELMEINL